MKNYHVSWQFGKFMHSFAWHINNIFSVRSKKQITHILLVCKKNKRTRASPSHIVFFSNFSPEFWLLLNTGWLRACSGPLRISINIKACICHILGGGGGGGWGGWGGSIGDGAQLTGGWSDDGVVGAICKTDHCHTVRSTALKRLTVWVYLSTKHFWSKFREEFMQV